MKKLFLDDMRLPTDVFNYIKNEIYLEDWHVVKNYDEFVDYITNNGIPEYVSFDHDLGYVELSETVSTFNSNEKTGYHCAKWLIEYIIDNNLDVPKAVLIHSMNPTGGENINSLFETYNKIYK